ncbi:mitochondrial protein cyt-4 [Xylaria sp. CBS 124048]|nr:mitochondrial protein cyt-4 [Xylaria sp. CBS 124048]
MLQASRRSYVCWQCATRRSSPAQFSGLRRPSAAGSLSIAVQFTNNSVLRRNLATVQSSGANHDVLEDASPALSKRQRPDIRQRLRKWEQENPSAGQAILDDFPFEGDLTNSITRPQNSAMIAIEVGDSSPLFARDELVDLRSDDAMLDPGDLVELSATASRRPALAINLGTIHGYQHFYSISGKWFSAASVRALFVVKNFATPEELKPVLEAIPRGEVSIEDLYNLQDLGEGPSRSAGSVLLRKMMQFAQDSESVYMENSDTLDAAGSLICDPTQHTYFTLHEIADRLVGRGKIDVVEFNTRYLYAVHRALLQDDAYFRPLRHVGHNRSYLFEVSPRSEVNLVQNIKSLARNYAEAQGDVKNKNLDNTSSSIESFAKKAQKLIDASRKNRAYTESGIVGPSHKATKLNPQWTETDLQILQFIELWASYRKYAAHSYIQSLGSQLLRAVDRYESYLPVTGWTFLQEIGWIPPWEIPARYNLRLPGVGIKRGGGYIRPLTAQLEDMNQDKLASIRQPLVGSTAYCIDDITAHEIDDAVSLERTSNPEEFWIHVHVADPASSIAPTTKVAQYAELIPESIYLAGHVEAMLPPEIIHDKFSLAPGRPSLTFSALVNTNGDVLDERISANTLDKVVYITYHDTVSVLGEAKITPADDEALWGIGSKPKSPVPNRKMSRPEDLTESQKSDLAVLSKLGKAMQAKRLEKGATPFFTPRPRATVDFDDVKKIEAKDFIAASGDPSIFISGTDGIRVDLVENAMKMANEIAARWCFKRGIPIPYRTQPHAARNAELARQYMRDVLIPMLASGARVEGAVWRHMHSLIGVDQVSTTPKPHFLLGTDMYTKATSPLRRYSDLIVHWQIEATLLEEARRGSEIVIEQKPKGDHAYAFLPFSRDRLDRMLPILHLREKQARLLGNADGSEHWILQALLRAWKFKEASLPETFTMIVEQRARARVFGRINWFDRSVILDPSQLNDIILSKDLRIGDVLEVKLTDVNVYTRQVFVGLLRILKRADDGEGASNSQVPLDGSKADKKAATVV